MAHITVVDSCTCTTNTTNTRQCAASTSTTCSTCGVGMTPTAGGRCYRCDKGQAEKVAACEDPQGCDCLACGMLQ